jgi:hypothetical protein
MNMPFDNKMLAALRAMGGTGGSGGGGSGGSSGVLVVTLTDNNGTLVADKTFNEVSSAIEAGSSVFLVDKSTGFITHGLVLTQYVPGAVVAFAQTILTTFSGDPNALDMLIYQTVGCTPDNTWIRQDAQHKLSYSPAEEASF